MPDAPDLAQLNEALAGWFARMTDAQEAATDEVLRRQLEALTTKVRDSQATFSEQYGKAVADLNERLDAARQRAKDTMDKAAAARSAAADAAPTLAPFDAPPPPPPVEVDPKLGMRLRQELLQRFGKRQQPGEPRSEDREIWEDWS